MSYFCPHCGKQHDDRVNFCSQCGTKMPDVQIDKFAYNKNASSGLTLGIISFSLLFILYFFFIASIASNNYIYTRIILYGSFITGIIGIFQSGKGLKSNKKGMAIPGLILSIISTSINATIITIILIMVLCGVIAITSLLI